MRLLTDSENAAISPRNLGQMWARRSAINSRFMYVPCGADAKPEDIDSTSEIAGPPMASKTIVAARAESGCSDQRLFWPELPNADAAAVPNENRSASCAWADAAACA